MNVQEIFNALALDDENSALGIICTELENQGYAVAINGMNVTGEKFFDGEYSDIEESLEPLKITLLKDGKIEQEFMIEFIEFHDIVIKPATD